MEPILPPTDPPPLNPPKAPQETPKIPGQLEQYHRYHNRLASFHDWPLEWEVYSAKPSPEVLARAGFFSQHEPPHERDNVVCPYCKLFLDLWEPGDDPLVEHRLRAPHCEFLRGPGCARRRHRPLDAGGSVTQSADAAKEEKGKMTMIQANKAVGEANGTSTEVNLGKANEVDTAVSNTTGGPSKEITREDARGVARGGARGSTYVGRVQGTDRGPGRPRGISAWQGWWSG